MAGDGTPLADQVDQIERIIAIMRARCGVDFGAYRDGTVRRRIANRMLCAGVGNPSDYLDLLERSEAETWQLLDRLTIKVSRFCRDRAVFDHLHQHLVPLWRRTGRPVRIWSAGCARGEEAYSLALLLAHAGVAGTVLATDIDPAALAFARAGRYPADALVELGAADVARFFLATDDHHFEVRDELRARVSFTRHDLTTQPPPGGGGFDLVACRNVLIYLKRPAQQAVLASLVAALAPGGHLCLGEAEWPHPELMPALQPLPRRTRTFRRAVMAPHAGAAA